MTYDLIIVTKSIDDLIAVTQRCIDSALADSAKVNVILIETGQPYRYQNVDKFIEYNGQFNYNRALNMGLKYAKDDIHILANNDLIFQKGWSIIGPLMRANGYHSASAWSSCMPGYQKGYVYEGYQIGSVLAGWCIFIDDYVLEKIGKLDETVSFWFSDNLYGCQLRAAGIKHGMFTDCIVDHLGSLTMKKHPIREQRKMALSERNKFKIRQRYYDTGN